MGWGVKHWVLETLWPRRCPGCGRPIPEPGADWCTDCSLALAKAVGISYCPTCGAVANPLVVAGGRCPSCLWKQVWHDRLVRVGGYDGAIRAAITGFKYRRQKWLDRLLVDLMLASLTAHPWFDEVRWVVPVPTHWLRRWWRGYHHVGLLADELAGRSGKRSANALRVVRRVRPQVGLDHQQRLANIKGAFGVKRGVERLTGPVCLIDDVTTTGATLREATRVLGEAGAGPIYAAVVAKAGGGDERFSLTAQIAESEGDV